MGGFILFIHTVNLGESLFSIGNMYGISIDQLRLVNGLEQTSIVPGQALLIPLYVYTVQPGDTMSSISQKSLVPLDQLLAANSSIDPYYLQPGIQITIPDISNYLASTLSYYAIRTPELDRALISDFAPYSTIISMFEYNFGPNGEIVNKLNDIAAIEEAWRNRVTPLVTITNLIPEGFSTELAHQVLNNPSARTTLVDNILYLISAKGYGGVNIDFERIRADDRDLFTGFLQQLKNRLEPEGYLLSIAVPAKTSESIPWLLGYDYGGIGAVVDNMFIMAYDWYHSQSEPGPVAPITEIRKTIEFALTNVPRNKIILGVPLYGYDWLLPYQPGTVAQALSNQDAMGTAMRYQSPIQYSEEFQTPFFQYADEQGRTHEVWFEDVRSMSAKMELVRDYNLRGLGAWQLTLGFAAGPWLLTKFFTVRKI